MLTVEEIEARNQALRERLTKLSVELSRCVGEFYVRDLMEAWRKTGDSTWIDARNAYSQCRRHLEWMEREGRVTSQKVQKEDGTGFRRYYKVVE